MTDVTALQIAARLRREDLPAAEYQELLRGLTARRAHLKARLESIESRNGAARRAAMASADPAQFAALNREAETLDDELGILCDLESRVSQLHTRACDRETIEKAHKGHKRLPALIERAAAALVAYENARRELDDVLGAIGMAKQTDAKLTIEPADFERIAAAMFPPIGLQVHPDALAQARRALRRRICAPDPPQYADVGPDYREQLRDVMSSPFRRRAD